MRKLRVNHYERAVGNWLRDSGVNFLTIDEEKRASLGGAHIKSFDFLLTLDDGRKLIAEVKGRKFKGTSVAGLGGFQSWVTYDDVKSLESWEQVFGGEYSAAFIFAYLIENVDVDLDGRSAYEFDGRGYLFFAVMLDDYKRHMRVRSPKWKTVALGADAFRQVAIELGG